MDNNIMPLEEQSCHIKYFQYLVTLFISLCLLLSQLNVGFGIYHMNTPICTKTITTNINNTYIVDVQEITPTINLSIWLIVNGFIWQYLIILSIMYYLIDNNIDQLRKTFFGSVKKNFLSLYPPFMTISFLFMFCWLIVGCKSIWTDCGYNIETDKEIEITMTFTLITEIIGLISILCWLIWFSVCK